MNILLNFLQYAIIFVGKSSTLQRYNIFNYCFAFLTLSVAFCANIVLLLLFCTKITGSWHYQNYSILSKNDWNLKRMTANKTETSDRCQIGGGMALAELLLVESYS
jgi:hypothetical protein